jgi:hypothetical protein
LHPGRGRTVPYPFVGRGDPIRYFLTTLTTRVFSTASARLLP